MLLTPLQSGTFERLDNDDDEYQPLFTKFISPVAGQIIQTQMRLLTLLQQGLSYPLVLVSAPAGSDKTTLLSQWIEALADKHVSTAWVSLDANDNEPFRFWNVLLTALARKMSAFRSIHWEAEEGSTLTLLKCLINISATQPGPIGLVLDDFHTITDRTIQGQMTYFIEHLSPHVHIVISTHVDPHISSVCCPDLSSCAFFVKQTLHQNIKHAAELITACYMHVEAFAIHHENTLLRPIEANREDDQCEASHAPGSANE